MILSCLYVSVLPIKILIDIMLNVCSRIFFQFFSEFAIILTKGNNGHKAPGLLWLFVVNNNLKKCLIKKNNIENKHIMPPVVV